MELKSFLAKSLEFPLKRRILAKLLGAIGYQKLFKTGAKINLINVNMRIYVMHYPKGIEDAALRQA